MEQMNTLLVEDDPTMLATLQQILEVRGHHTSAYPDAAQARFAFDSQHFDMVILDRFLPDHDGLELCRALRGLPGGSWPIILVFTNAKRPEDMRAAVAAGADDYMTKPLDLGLMDVRLTIAESQVRQRQKQRETEHERDEARKRAESSRDDMQSILNRLRVGTAITDPQGRLTFISEAARRLFGLSRYPEGDKPWQEVFPLDAETKALLKQQQLKPPAQRTRVPAKVALGADKQYWMEIEVQDDPRDSDRQIFALYDVTEVEQIKRQLKGSVFRELVGNSEEMQAVFQMIRELTRVDSTVLLEGETGTGKELVARAIHQSSPRSEGPFIAVNCAGLPESLVTSLLFGHRRGAFTGAVEDHKGVFESANGGTLFLDEIGDIPPGVQTSLLRVLQEREITRLGENRARKIDVRVLAATHHDLGALVEEGRFRMDLLYRIRVARVSIPPLRDRRKDVPLLAAHFVDEIADRYKKARRSIAPGTLQALIAHRWPGNVRELRGAIEYALIRSQSPTLQPEDLPPEILNTVSSTVRLGSHPDDQRARILEALNQAKGNRSRAATLLGISRATFYRQCKSLGLGPS